MPVLVLRVVITAALVAVLGACGASESETRQGGGQLRIQLFGDAEEVRVYQRLADAYREKTGTRVLIAAVPDRDAHLQKLTTSFAARRPPDVFLVNYRNFAGFAPVLDPAGPRLDRDGGLDRTELYPQALEAFTLDGELQCMPQNVSSLVVYVNHRLFEKAGVALPRADWTMRDLKSTAAALQRRLGEGADALGLDPRTVRAAPFVWAAGGDLVDDDNRPTRFTLDTPAARAGLRTLLDLAPYGPEELEARGKALDVRFLDGELAMFMSSRVEVPTFRQIEGFKWDVAPFPRGKLAAGILHSDAYCIPKGGGADDAWRFVEFAAGVEGARITATGGRTVPSVRSVAQSSAFLSSRQPPRSSQVFLDAVPRIRRLPVSTAWPVLEDGADIAIEEAFYKGQTVDELLARLRKETDGKFR